jgi:hypothetical protein
MRSRFTGPEHSHVQDVLRLQPARPHGQSISGVFSIAAHSVLQYLPDVITHKQMGCAHFWPFAVVISFFYSQSPFPFS